MKAPSKNATQQVGLVGANVAMVKSKVAANVQKSYLELQRSQKIRDLTRRLAAAYIPQTAPARHKTQDHRGASQRVLSYAVAFMVEVSISDDHLHLEVKGMDKLWAFKSQFDIPLRHIRGVRHDPEAAAGWCHGVKVMGTNVPGVITAGTFYQCSGRTMFWDVHDPNKSIIIELHDDRFDELIVEVGDPRAAVEQISVRLNGEGK